MRDMLRVIEGEGLRAVRDRAVLALGMAAALRRSEIVALTLEDIELVPQGMKILIRGSKTDQERAGVVIAIPEGRSEEHTSELKSLMRISYAVFCLKKKNKRNYLNQ